MDFLVQYLDLSVIYIFFTGYSMIIPSVGVGAAQEGYRERGFDSKSWMSPILKKKNKCFDSRKTHIAPVKL